MDQIKCRDMKFTCPILTTLTALLLTIALTAQPLALKKLPWQEEKIDKGLVWLSLHTDQLFSSRQNINVLEVTRRNRVFLAYSQDTLLPTSTFAARDSALAAVNAGFFNTKEGGSVTYLKDNWKRVTGSDSALVAKKSELLEGALLIDRDRWIQIEKTRPEQYYDLSYDSRTALFTGPLLLVDDQISPLEDNAFNNNRHPRTAACLTDKKRLLLVTVDGRNAQAEGMSLPELTRLLQGLGCATAINLDGGGSTTMYIHGKPDNGVVNMPSDNKQFDHAGERPVANALLIKGPPPPPPIPKPAPRQRKPKKGDKQ